MTKMLTHCQARWSEYLSTFNITIRFCPGKLGAKTDALTCCPDVYPKGGGEDYLSANPQNYRPVFTEEQLTMSLHATGLEPIVNQVLEKIDSDQLHKDILESLITNKFAQDILSKPIPPESRHSVSPSGLLLINHHIYVPDSSPATGNLCTSNTLHLRSWLQHQVPLQQLDDQVAKCSHLPLQLVHLLLQQAVQPLCHCLPHKPLHPQLIRLVIALNDDQLPLHLSPLL